MIRMYTELVQNFTVKYVKSLKLRQCLLVLFILFHLIFSVLLGELFAFAPDEIGYLSAFNTVFTLPVNTLAQSGSGWITAPTLFLWIIYAPAKLINLLGVSDLLSIRILSIAGVAISLYLLLKIQTSKNSFAKFPQFLIFSAFLIASKILTDPSPVMSPV